MEEQEAHQMMEIHVYTQQGITATFSLSPNDTVKTLFSILMESFPPAALGSQSCFHLFFQNIQLKRNNKVRDEIERIVIESKLEEPEQDQIWLRFVPNPSCGSARCDKVDCLSGNTRFKYYRYGRMWKLRYFCRTCRKEFNLNMPQPPKPTKIAPPLPLPPTVASSSSSSSVLDLSDRVLGNCRALHQYNAQLQMEKSSLEKKNKASEQALTSLEAWMEEKARCVQGGA
ncbi:PREDICTED: uncharacterized protein LOC101291471 [Fragaria vesca subsp. vesca]|uniref:uncharacterized protein LOC101291471 n=1 Tax=Fragaria vesca subsp. vesca TaxID=101020 RepID=UPI0002C32922|nr:PREDICTED: uncharacterized protein LOC101291471 [Fragaria vesca subsp. vesca]